MVREHGSEHPSHWRPGLTTDKRQRLKQLERENRQLQRANEILKKASAYFAHITAVKATRACSLLNSRIQPIRVRYQRGEVVAMIVPSSPREAGKRR
jgi:transposase-like protein